MRFSQILIHTLRDDPADAEVPSHRLLARGGFIVKAAAGLYSYSPLMWRVIKKVFNIVREELDREDAQEVMLPIMQPKELWVSSGRWDRYVADGIMFSLQDRKGADMCLGPTHEEVITSYVNTAVNSYKQLPINLYQIQDKFRDEIRPRFGLMRGREFIMMDAYSFDVDRAGLDNSYQKMDRAYRAIFDRCGVKYTVVDADAGAIGGAGSQEFMVVADTGEDAILYCDACKYAANVEKASAKVTAVADQGEPKPLERHDTPEVRTVEQLQEFFDLPAEVMAKTVLYNATFADREEIVAVMMRGDLEINEVKLCNALDALAVKLADEQQIKKVSGAEVGFAGPVGLNEDVRLLADSTLEKQTNLLTGCNENGVHCLNVNLGRDSSEAEFHELCLARAGDGCPKCDDSLQEVRGIEVGHIFKLGTKYSSAMGATFMAESGKPAPFEMGCYGIGVSRTPAAAVEQHYDDKGIVWPVQIAPFEVVVAFLDKKRDKQVELAMGVYEELQAAGIDVALDDRKMSPGAKFKDLELLGFPVTVVVGRKADEDIVEFGIRKDGEKSEIPVSEAVARCKAALEQLSGPMQ
ncbi:MAG: proline--tRNA ligase [Planctomycetota bacterium]|nr:proline--tRNA ligase [Planctomycetota bacterium]